MTELTEAAENIRNASRVLRAYMRFQDRVAAVAIDLAEHGDPAALLLLDAMKDLQASTGELYVENANERTR